MDGRQTKSRAPPLPRGNRSSRRNHGRCLSDRAANLRCMRPTARPRSCPAPKLTRTRGGSPMTNTPADKTTADQTTDLAATTVSPTQPTLARIHIPRRLFSTLEGAFNEEIFFLILCVFIGIFSGLAVVCFRLAIDWTHLALLGPLPQNHGLRLFAVPPLAGRLRALLVLHLFPSIRGRCDSKSKAALYTFKDYSPFRTP